MGEKEDDEKCERCGGDIGIVPTICWNCFYSFWNMVTPEQREIVKKIQSEAVDNFAEKVKEELEEAMRLKVRFSPERDPDQRLFRCGLEEDWQKVWKALKMEED